MDSKRFGIAEENGEVHKDLVGQFHFSYTAIQMNYLKKLLKQRIILFR